MTNHDNYGGYERYGSPRSFDPQQHPEMAEALAAIHRGDRPAARAALDRAVAAARSGRATPGRGAPTTQTPEPTGDGNDRGHPAADRSTA